MSKLELLRTFYEYNEYANNRLLGAAAKLSPDDLSRKQGASFESIEGNLAHIMAGQVVWLARWRAGSARPEALVGRAAGSGRSSNPGSLEEMQAVRGIDPIRAAFDHSHADLRDFLSTLTDDRLEETLAYKDSRGDAYQRVFWQLMLHVANHGSYHRAETAMALTAMGHNPGDLDYSKFEIAREAGHVR